MGITMTVLFHRQCKLACGHLITMKNLAPFFFILHVLFFQLITDLNEPQFNNQVF